MPSEEEGGGGIGACRDVVSGGRAVAFNATFIIKQHERHKEATQTHASGTCTHTHTHRHTWPQYNTQNRRESKAESYTAAFMSALNGC